MTYPVQTLGRVNNIKPLLSFTGLGENCDCRPVILSGLDNVDSIDSIDSIDITCVVVDYNDVVIVPLSW